MEYYYCKEDKYNNIHSIDNVIITYFLTCTLDFALGHIKMISDCSTNYWEKLNVSRCSRYSYFNNIIHFTCIEKNMLTYMTHMRFLLSLIVSAWVLCGEGFGGSLAA